ncbi:DUF4179 domain-containing protein [Paenibacillus sp. JX-17]|uniref:DUF4179 domain-containing protein n=1 Tax=Paenibacillus lacisoli TaxID=3064525 RepID=A0ABT9CGI1_9BACL|nr:DUF4179 domain-containing protein [Paenibacillus sp. JX-17]MDO7907673.1 DUF4179 domain-containing protein [Paenibacillus sp. JX-17]
MNSRRLEDDGMSHLEQMIRDTPVEVDLVEKTFHRYIVNLGTNKNKAPKRRPITYKILVTAASAAVIIALVMGTGFVSPAMAQAMKQIPGMAAVFQIAGDLGLKTADEKALLIQTSNHKITHSGITLKVPVVVYDGTRVSVGLESETESANTGQNINDLIRDIQLSINGKPISVFAPANTDNFIDPYMVPSKDSSHTIIQFSDRSNQGGPKFPDRFDLGLKITLDGIREPFAIEVPVTKTGKNVVINADIHKKFNRIQLELEKVEFTPITTVITTRIQVPESSQSRMPDLNYDILDEHGNSLQLVSGNGWNPTNGHTLIADTRFEPVTAIPKSITIKVFKYMTKADDPSQFELDADGYPKKEYIPELEMKVPVH